MADGISIPGVTDRYKTNDLVEKLMEVERIPLKREQEQLQKYQDQQAAWRGVTQKMSSLRESVKSLYSFENPFNNKSAVSSDERAVTADVGRGADYGSFKIDVIQPATADRFLSGNVDRNMRVEAGLYIFSVGEKTIEFNWKGGKLTDFVTSLNKRGANTIKATVIGVSSKERALLLESLKPGLENRLRLQGKALEFASAIGMVTEGHTNATPLPSSVSDFSSPQNLASSQGGLPALSKNGVTSDGETITLPARSGVEIPIPASAKEGEDALISFSYSATPVEDLSEALIESLESPKLPSPGRIDYKGITVLNEPVEPLLSMEDGETQGLQPVSDDRLVFIKNKDGSETELPDSAFVTDLETGLTTVTISLSDYPDAQALVLRNSNTAKQIAVSVPQTYDGATEDVGFTPNHAISQASDAQFKYEGITITRPTNDIDDVIPDVTLHLHEKTEKTATIQIESDIESAKDALITFVGKYNQVLAEINILTSNKPEIISELDYLTDAEIEEKNAKLGMFQGDFTLQNGKSQLQRIVSGNYRYSEDSLVSMLSQIGISTNASGRSSGYSASQMRGYLEVNEKTLDEQLEQNLEGIKDLFGYDTDDDLIIDNGIGYLLDKQLTAWVQSGGIIANKTSTLEGQIKSSSTKISKLEVQMEAKEAELKQKYSTMESTLNSLESQQNSITNWSNSMNQNNR